MLKINLVSFVLLSAQFLLNSQSLCIRLKKINLHHFDLAAATTLFAVEAFVFMFA